MKKGKTNKSKNMEKSIINLAIIILTITSQVSIAQTRESNSELIQESKEKLDRMLEKSPNLQFYYDQSYGYAIFPKVTKVGISLGVAAGKGMVFKNHLAISTSKLKQLTYGLQFGAQKYCEVIFFQNESAFERFMNKKLKSYSYGAAIFTQAIGGLMFEASVGGQHFSNQPIED
jgi:lipid-binding SYLF domain-containing protein